MQLVRLDVGGLLVHLLTHDAVAVDDVLLETATTPTIVDSFGVAVTRAGMPLVHIDDTCSAITRHPDRNATAEQILTAVSSTQLRGTEPAFPQRCDRCWATPTSGARVPTYLMRHRKVLEHLELSAGVDNLFESGDESGNKTLAAATGTHRYLMLRAGGLTDITDPALAEVSLLLGEQRARLAGWTPDQTPHGAERMLGEGGGSSWVVVHAVNATARPADLRLTEHIVLEAIGLADYLEVLPGATWSLLAKIPTELATYYTDWDPSGAQGQLQVLSEASDEFTVDHIRAALQVEEDLSPANSSAILGAVRTAMTS